MKQIILVRHGESESNVDKNILRTKPNHLIELTAKGQQQAIDVGKRLKNSWDITRADFIVSPHVRARQTYQFIKESISPVCNTEDFRVREVDIGNFIDDFEKIRKERHIIGKFNYRFPNGESMADVAIRVKMFLIDVIPTLFSDIPTIIVTHAGTMNVIKMLIENLTVEQFDNLPKPENCAIVSYSL